ncbi:MAG: HAD family hydrolase [Chitinophagaceae bacterium]|nr:HAD family hydrolase [Oligoflexus sp.]
MPIFDDIESRIQKALRSKLRPLVVFDVDDTLVDCRYRKAQVFQDFAKQPAVRSQWLAESQTILDLSWERLRYRVQDNLDMVNITSETFRDAIFDHWIKNYFTYPYLLKDRAFPGAQQFVKKCQDMGAHIVYLTARDHMGMYQGTIEALDLLKFPMHSPDIHIMLKPEVSMNDHHFKVGALEQIASLGEVVASFENELVNLNAMAERFPNAAMYWRNTLYAPDPPPPHPRVEILAHFP